MLKGDYSICGLAIEMKGASWGQKHKRRERNMLVCVRVYTITTNCVLKPQMIVMVSKILAHEKLMTHQM